jgi:tetratricopeptide (TPR) repeat protein
LRRLRERAALTQEQLAERAGLSPRAISALERGERQHPYPHTIQALATALDLSVEERTLLAAVVTPRGRQLALQEPKARAQPPEPQAGIPPEPIARFVGRETELEQLHEQLQQHRRAAVHGLGGIGKTQLALHYLHQRRDEYPDGVFWVRADQETSLVGDLASLAWRLRLPEREEPEQARQIEAVLRWLRQHERWLLVLDNLDQPAVRAMRHWLSPGLSGGHVLTTSRSPLGPSRLGLEPLPLGVAVGFLLDRTGQDDAAAARAVAETVDGLPLALEQAAAYIEVSGRVLASYAGLLRTRMGELMREGKPVGYPLPVATTWALSFQRIEEERPAAADLLRLCAFLGSDDIPISVLQEGGSELPASLPEALGDELECDRALRALRDCSLMERQGDGLWVHRLVQWVVRESLGADQWEQWLAACARLLRATFPGEVENPQRWSLCARLLPHTQTMVGLTGGREVEPQALSWLLDRVASYLQTRAQYALARPLFERALAVRERVPGPNHPDTGQSLINLALLFRHQGEVTAARPLFERALAIAEGAQGTDHPETVACLIHLASQHLAEGEPAAARLLFERAVAISERMAGPRPSVASTSLKNIADLLQVQGALVAAAPNLPLLLREPGELAALRPLLERVFAVTARALGSDHPLTATSLNNLANLLQVEGDLAAARHLYERALAIRERVLGFDHPDIAHSLNSLGLVLTRQGELRAARPLYERALAIRERLLGHDHPDTASSLNNLGRLRWTNGELSAARPLLERALAVRERALGAHHPRTIRSRQRLEELISELDRSSAS